MVEKKSMEGAVDVTGAACDEEPKFRSPKISARSALELVAFALLATLEPNWSLLDCAVLGAAFIEEDEYRDRIEFLRSVRGGTPLEVWGAATEEVEFVG